ncbi:MAG: glycosyltransferase family 4 protein [Acidimicrobiia bacterium]|nr:glycosyltransferase family 4 protein [Acidimicrobiia bacterium]
MRIALLVYRGNPHSGGQGVYTHHLSRQLAAMGHHVEVFSGQPYPNLAPEVPLVKVPSLDLYRADDPFHVPHLSEFHSAIDVLEFAIMCTAGFPEPRTFSRRIRKMLNRRHGDFDVVHDNQCLGNGIRRLLDDGFPIVETLHHPITVDRRLELAQNPWTKRPIRQLTLRRWFGFLRMQCRVARQMPRIITVSESSRRDITRDMGVPYERMSIVPVGVDTDHFRPLPHIERVPGRIMTTASADVALKGLVPLLEAVAKVRTEREAELLVVGKPRDGSSIPATIERLGLEGAVRFVSGVDPERMVELYAEASVAVVPSLYEGFSLPAIEAMACGVPLVSTTGGALPEVVGPDGVNALTVPPGDPGALAGAIGRVLDDAELRARLSVAGRHHVLDRYTWAETARQTVEQYRLAIAEQLKSAQQSRMEPRPC